MKLLITIIIFLIYSSLFSQKEIYGTVTNEQNQQLESVVITIKDSLQSILVYTITDKKGEYTLNLKPPCATCIIEFSSLGYQKVSNPIAYTTINERLKLDIILKTESFSLDEVIISSPKPINIKKDTIVFTAKSFSDGTETVAEDLLRKIPGVSISDDGTIKIGNKEVEKVMVDGDDFFEKGYKLLTKNLPAAPIEKIELLQRYSNNPLLKGIEESDKVALNLKFDEDSKRQWFGTIDAGYGVSSEGRYDLRINLLNFGKKNKYYFFSNLNNIGYNATGDISSLIRSSRAGEPGSIGDSEKVNQLITLTNTVPFFKESRFRFNDAELLSLNAIFNPTDRLKIKSIGFLNWDELSFFRNSADTFSANQTNFTNTEDYTLNTDYLTLFGKLDINYKLSKTETVQFLSKHSNTDNQKESSIIFNNTPITQNLTTDNTRFDQKISYSNKINNHKAFLITARYINEQSPQSFIINQNNFTSLFENSNTNDLIGQNSKLNYQYFGIEAHLLDRKESGNLFELKLGNSHRDDDLISTLRIQDTPTTVEFPIGFQNNTNYIVNDTYLTSKYLFSLSEKWSIIGTISGHYIFNYLDENNDNNNENIFFLNPSLSTSWEINDKNKINLFTSLTRRNATITNVYENFTLNGFRSFTRSTGDFNQLDATRTSLNYTLGNWSDIFFATAFLSYTKSFDFFSTDSDISQDFSLSERILFKDREIWSASFSANRYFTFLSSNVKGLFSFSSINFQNIVNDSPLRQINSNNYSYGLEMRSAFSGFFNYHIGTTWRANTIISEGFKTDFTNNKTFLDFTFIFNEKFNIQLQTERYFFGNLETENTYYFADLESKYELKKNKLSLSLSGKNLFNTEIFREFSINDLGSSTTEYRLLPRYLLLKLTYRF